MRPFLILTSVLLAATLACSISSSPPYEPPIITQSPIPSEPSIVNISVYFTITARYAVGIEPYEEAVMRTIPTPASLPEAVLTQLFVGPTETEMTKGLEVVLSGTTGFSKLTIENGIARVYLKGTCNSQGATYTIANLIYVNLTQFPEIQWVKIYDQNGETETPDGQTSSIPFCLEP